MQANRYVCVCVCVLFLFICLSFPLCVRVCVCPYACLRLFVGVCLSVSVFV